VRHHHCSTWWSPHLFWLHPSPILGPAVGRSIARAGGHHQPEREYRRFSSRCTARRRTLPWRGIAILSPDLVGAMMSSHCRREPRRRRVERAIAEYPVRGRHPPPLSRGNAAPGSRRRGHRREPLVARADMLNARSCPVARPIAALALADFLAVAGLPPQRCGSASRSDRPTFDPSITRSSALFEGLKELGYHAVRYHFKSKR